MVWEFNPKSVVTLRQKAGATQHKFGISVGTVGHHVKAWEDGTVIPKIESVMAMCNKYDVEPGYFFRKKARKQSKATH